MKPAAPSNAPPYEARRFCSAFSLSMVSVSNLAAPWRWLFSMDAFHR
jgi:hypothetical protein